MNSPADNQQHTTDRVLVFVHIGDLHDNSCEVRALVLGRRVRAAPRKAYIRPYIRALIWGGEDGMAMCEEKERLTLEYQMATEKFSQSVTNLRQKMVTSSQDEYERLKRITEEWRVHSEDARLSLEQHVVRA
jgi:hypothetical protein